MKVPITLVSALYATELTPLEGDIPGRSVYFGAVRENLPVTPAPFASRTCQLLAAAVMLKRAEFEAILKRYNPARVAVILGTSDTGVDEAQRVVEAGLAQGAMPPEMCYENLALGTPAEFLARELGVTGPAYAISTACSSSAKVFPAARRLLEAGLCDVAVVGGADARCRFALNGFHALGALAAEKCRPLASDRDGICLGEGAALFLLEPNGTGDCAFVGAGETSDAYHPTAPDPEGRGAEAAMRAALAEAALGPQDVTYVNLHGTGTQANDAMELAALARVFGSNPPPYESTKNQTGHCLGAAGAVEAAICLKHLHARGDVALSNSFAFGGSNVSLVFARTTKRG